MWLIFTKLQARMDLLDQTYTNLTPKLWGGITYERLPITTWVRQKCYWTAMTTSFVGNRVTRLVDFWKFLTTKFSYKSIPNMWWLFVLFKIHYLSKNCNVYILGNFWNNFGNSISTSAHTGGKRVLCRSQSVSKFCLSGFSF